VKGGKSKPKKAQKEEDPYEAPRPSWHVPKINNKVTAESMRKIDVSTANNDEINLEHEQSKYLGGDDEKLKGFYDSDEEPQFEMGLGAGQ
jgi:hypothetical protein